MATKCQPLVDYIAAREMDAVTLSFTEIEAIVGNPLPETMRVDISLWTREMQAIVWRLEAIGWRARLDRCNRCVHFTRDAGEGTEQDGSWAFAVNGNCPLWQAS